MSELSRLVRLDIIGEGGHRVAIEADPAERAAVAQRFGLVALDRLTAEVELRRAGERIDVTGRLTAAVVQACVATGEDIRAAIDEPFALAFVPEAAPAGEEVELDEGALDIVPYHGSAIDVGEAVSQTLGLALDPYPRAPDADQLLLAAGVLREGETGAFAGLAALKAKLGG